VQPCQAHIENAADHRGIFLAWEPSCFLVETRRIEYPPSKFLPDPYKSRTYQTSINVKHFDIGFFVGRPSGRPTWVGVCRNSRLHANLTAKRSSSRPDPNAAFRPSLRPPPCPAFGPGRPVQGSVRCRRIPPEFAVTVSNVARPLVPGFRSSSGSRLSGKWPR